jgi:hypothetical protein
MPDLGDLDLDRGYEPETIRRRPAAWRVVLFVVLLGIVGYLIWRLVAPGAAPGQDVRVATDQQIAAPTKPAGPQAVAGDDVVLPALPDTDPVVRQLVGQLSAHPRIAAWLATDQLIRNFAVIVLNIGDGRSPSQQLRAVKPTGAFVAAESGTSARIDPRSYRRYDEYADAIGALDAQGMARLYATLKPRLQDAYRELGYPDGNFDRAMQKALRELLTTPVPEGDVALVSRSVAWEFADPRLQSLTAAQRQFIRMGPRNMRIVQAKLREFAPLAGLEP